jgi:ribosome-associated toxin RatA of RatAB toxin-antitoxin module
MPTDRAVRTVDERLVHAPAAVIFELARAVDRWPRLLPHYRWVRVHERARDGGGVVEMAAWRPFGPARWPTWWLSEMAVDDARPAIRFRHVRGITSGMEVEWTFMPRPRGTLVRIVHVWNGPRWPMVGTVAARAVIGPVFVHGIASRTLAGLARWAERERLRGETA